MEAGPFPSVASTSEQATNVPAAECALTDRLPTFRWLSQDPVLSYHCDNVKVV